MESDKTDEYVADLCDQCAIDKNGTRSELAYRLFEFLPLDVRSTEFPDEKAAAGGMMVAEGLKPESDTKR